MSSWLGGSLLADNIPIVDGSLTVDATQKVPERLTFTVPRWDPETGIIWTRANSRSPLACDGQRLRVVYGIRRANTTVLNVQLGWFQVIDGEDDGEQVHVEAVGLLNVVEEDRLLSPTKPAASSTLGAEVVRLMSASVAAYVDPALPAVVAPESMAWDEDRLQALYDIAAAWPARIVTDSSGTVRFVQPTNLAPVYNWVDGAAGTVVRAPRKWTRDGVYNAVVVRSSTTDSASQAPIQEVMYDGDSWSSTRWGGPYGNKPRFFASPLISDVGQARRTGGSLVLSSRVRAQSRIVECAPDPRVEVYDPASVTYRGETMTGYVSAYTLPLTAAGGAMHVTLAPTGGPT